jgi:hypothetical protein
MISQSLYNWVNTIYGVLVIIFIEGLLGGSIGANVLRFTNFLWFIGSTYANAFYKISTNVPARHREFSMALAGVSDSGMISLSSKTLYLTL